MMLKWFPYAFILFICGIRGASAQQAPDAEWIGLTIPVSLGQHWQIIPEAGYRTYTSEYRRLQNFMRLNLRYRFNALNNLGSGMAFFATKLSLDEMENEFGREIRLFEEGNHSTPLSNKLSLQQRLRIEQRFYQATSQYSAHLVHRFRFLLNAQYKLHPKWYLNLSSEYMEALKNKSFSMDQWRMISMVSYIPMEGVQFNLGYFYVIRSAYQQNVFILTLIKSFGVNESRQHSS